MDLNESTPPRPSLDVLAIPCSEKMETPLCTSVSLFQLEEPLQGVGFCPSLFLQTSKDKEITKSAPLGAFLLHDKFKFE
jgi:hypothetical protein